MLFLSLFLMSSSIDHLKNRRVCHPFQYLEHKSSSIKNQVTFKDSAFVIFSAYDSDTIFSDSLSNRISLITSFLEPLLVISEYGDRLKVTDIDFRNFSQKQ